MRAAYLACDGDMGGLLDRVPCASVDSEDRLRAVVQSLIDAGQLPALPAFTNETKAKRAARKRRVSHAGTAARPRALAAGGIADRTVLRLTLLFTENKPQHLRCPSVCASFVAVALRLQLASGSALSTVKTPSHARIPGL